MPATPWHIRYVGSVEVAWEITDSGLVLEEYLEEFIGLKILRTLG